MVSDKTKNRLYAGLLIFADLAALAVVGFLVIGGGFEQSPWFHLILFGSLFGIAVASAACLPPAWCRGLGIHGVLIFGSLLFMFPFAWLVITSFKYPEEVVAYPPRWIPSVPQPLAASPFVSDDLFDEIEVPEGLSEGRWERLRPDLEALLWQKSLEMIPPVFLEHLDRNQVRPVLFHGLWNTVAPGIPPDVWMRSDDDILAIIEERTTLERLEDVWGVLYRCVAVRTPFVTTLERRDYPVPVETGELTPAYADPFGDVDLRVLPQNLQRGDPMLQLVYRFDKQSVAGIDFELPLPIPGDELLGITLPLRQDRTWHRLRVVLELDGRRYESRSALFLGWYRWQEMAFKLMDRDPVDERSLGTWPLTLAADQANAYDVPGRVRFRLELQRSGLLAAGFHKYAQSYRNAWRVGEHWDRYIANSLYLVVLTIVGQIISCSMVAYAFSRLRWPGRDILFFVLLATMMLPGQVTMVPVFLVFRTLGWYNTLKPLWIPAFAGAPFFIFLLRQFMKGIPRELEEAALIDGCSFWGIYWRIIVPLIKPALAAVGIFTFMGTWNEFMGPLIYINDQRLYPLALGLFEFRAEYGGDFGMLMAASTIMILPVIVLFFFAQKYFIQGVTLTGMKN